MMGLGSVSLVAAVQAGAVSVHLLDRFGQVSRTSGGLVDAYTE